MSTFRVCFSRPNDEEDDEPGAALVFAHDKAEAVRVCKVDPRLKGVHSLFVDAVLDWSSGRSPQVWGIEGMPNWGQH